MQVESINKRYRQININENKIPVYVAEEPLDCVVRGTAKTLENLQDLKTVLTSTRRR